jgi:PAS domain S-box-containing protein
MRSLRGQIITFVVLIEAALTLLILSSLFNINRVGVQEVLDEQKQAILILAEDNVRAGFITFDYTSLQTFMEALMVQPFVDQAMVIDRNDRVIASSNTAELGENAEQILNESWQITPIENASESFGYLAIQFNNNFFDTLLNRMLRTGILVSLLWVIISIGLGYYTGVYLNRRLKLLEDGAKTFSRKNYTHRINMNGRDEIARVAAEFDNMAAEIQQKINETESVVQALKESKENLRVTLDSIGDAVIATDGKGNITLMNPVAEQLTGWSMEEAVGKTLPSVFHIINEQTRTLVPNPVEKVLEAGETVGLANHTLLIAKDGIEYHIADSGAPIRDANNNIIGVVLVFRDATEKVRAEQEQLKLTKLESLGVLAGGIAHDFNNLLTALFGNIGLVKMSLSTDHEAHKYVDRSMLAMEHTTALTNQLLTFAKGGDPIKERITIGEVVTEAAQFSVRGSNVRLRIDIQPDLWFVEADKGQLSQVISNLVINGQQAMPIGGTVAIAVENVVISEGKYVQITVQDEGIGIAPQHLDKIFDPYFTTKQQGNGLGLASTYSIINKHNGRITVDSHLNEGTLFTIHLPAKEETETTLTRKLLTEPQPMPDFAARILVLDDEKAVREVLGDMLERMGHTVAYAVEGQEAIAKYRTAYESKAEYDLFITDLTIPGGLGGQAAAQEILKLNPQAKIIVSSGYATDPVLANYKAYGFKGIFVKPYHFAELQEVVRHVLSSARS